MYICYRCLRASLPSEMKPHPDAPLVRCCPCCKKGAMFLTVPGFFNRPGC